MQVNQQILFLDSQVANYPALSVGVLPGIEVIIIQSDRDGITQITAELNKRNNISTVHIVSHGAPGCLSLGNTQLSLDTLDKYRENIKTWSDQLSIINCPFSIALYGCNVAAGDAGEEFITKLHNITGAEIAASTTRVGNADKGGNWHLDYRTIEINPELAFTQEVQQNYAGIFPEDYGDAPDDGIAGNGAGDYTTLLSTGGANHTIDSNLTLGTLIDADAGTLQNNSADADDNNGSDDEDGVTFTEGTTISADDSDRSFSVNVVVNNSQTASTTVSDDFEDTTLSGGTGWAGDWVGGGQWINNDLQSGDRYLTLGWSSNGDALPQISRGFDGSAASGDATFSFNYSKGNLSADDGFEVTIHDGLGNSQVLFSFSNPTTLPNNVWDGVSYGSGNITIPQSYLTSTSRIAITTSGDLSDGAFYFDDFNLTFDSVKDTKVVGWVDFDRSGTFDTDEAVSLDTDSGLVTDGTTANTLTWTEFTDDITSDGDIAARFRVSTDETLDKTYSTGNLTDGEVEDYLLTVATVQDLGDAPDSLTGSVSATNNPNQDLPDYLTTEAEGGASHTIDENYPITIGTDVDPDSGSLQNDTATADDSNSTDDESGVYLAGTNTSINNADINSTLSTYSLDVIVNEPALAPTGVASTVTGTVYNDYDADGNYDGTQTITFDDGSATTTTEGGLAGITVNAYDNDGTLVGTDITDANGEYSISNPNGDPLRIEFSNLTTGYNNTSDTNVLVDGSGNSTVDLGLLANNQYVDSNSVPKLLTTCFVFGGYNQSGETALVSVLHTDEGTTPANKTSEVTYDKVGTVYGLAHSKQTQDIFLGAFQKRHTDVGAGGNDAIYRVDSNGNVNTLVELDTYFGTTDTAGVYAHGTIANNRTEANRPTDIAVDDTEWIRDEAAFAQVTKVGFGDVEISADGEHLWTINLADRQLYKIEIGDGSTYVAQGSESRTIDTFDIVNNLSGLDQGSRASTNDVIQDLRPFALAERDGLIYVGLVDSAQATQDASDLHAYVYSFDPTAVTPTFTKELDFALDYDRESQNSLVNSYVDSLWHPWVDNFSDLTTPSYVNPDTGKNEYWINENQPILSDIEFDNNGDIILGFRDRTADQVGGGTPDTDGNGADGNPLDGTNEYVIASGGDILRGTWNGSNWTIESGATDTDPHTEFYGGEELVNHEETAQGGLVQIPGYGSVETTALDPIQLSSGGILGLNNSDGFKTRGIELFINQPYIEKATGLGDLEYAGELAPIEIGNRLWLDLNGNGLQDAGETGIAGATVSLYNSDGSSLLGTTIADENGEYYFDQDNITGGLTSNTTYQIRLETAADFTTGGALEHLSLTTEDVNSNANDTLDSDAVDVSGTPTITVTTGEYGKNDYTNDFGFTKDITLVGWIDFDRSGTFDSDEAVTLDTDGGLIADGTTANTLEFAVPNDVETGETAARFRVASGLTGDNLDVNTANGTAPDGEVEDYIVNLIEIDIDFGDAPDISGGNGAGDYTTTEANSGASHIIDSNLTIGSTVDADDGTLQNTDATADDTNGSDDEDGITSFDTLTNESDIYSINVDVTNNTGADATLIGWIDFDGDGVFEDDEATTALVENGDTAEQLDWSGLQSLTDGINAGTTYARFRLSSDFNGIAIDDNTSIGSATDGEVEDYQITIKNEVTGTGSSEVINDSSTDPTTANADFITGGAGQDTLTGGTGDDCFHFDITSDGVDVITDFDIDGDKLDFSNIFNNELSSLTIPSNSNPYDEGYVEAITFGSGVMIIVDEDPNDSGDDLLNKDVVLLRNINVSGIDASDFIF